MNKELKMDLAIGIIKQIRQLLDDIDFTLDTIEFKRLEIEFVLYYIYELESRCEKAIEYINEEKRLSMFNDCSEPEEDWSYDLECDANDLLNILQNGSDKE